MALNIIDCTFRDGGYYNNWDFSIELSNNYLGAISKTGIQFVEIGYKRINTSAFLGPFAFCNESFLRKLSIPKNINLGVMVNIMDFNQAKSLQSIVNANFVSQKNSVIKFIRIATAHKTLELSLSLSAILKKLGYKVFINIMQSDSLIEKDFKNLAKKINGANLPEAFYFADTFGNLQYFKIKNLITYIKENFKTSIGFHPHNNINSALNNALFALENGVQWIDTTVLGMGRGAGNLQTEYLLLELEKKFTKFRPEPLYPLILGEFQALKEKYQWGENLLYRLAAIHTIHPSYIQELMAQGNFKNYQLLDAMDFLRKQKSKSFIKSKFNEAIFSYTANSVGNCNPSSFIKKRNVLIIANGPSLGSHSNALIEFIKQKNPIVISLNINKYIDNKFINAFACSHPSRIVLEANDLSKQKKPLITPFSSLPEELKIKFKNNSIHDYGLAIKKNKFAVNKENCTITSPLVLIYALSFCLSGQAKKIWLAGFDGYAAEDQRQLDINNALGFFNSSFQNCEITFVTPTTFKAKQISLHSIVK